MISSIEKIKKKAEQSFEVLKKVRRKWYGGLVIRSATLREVEGELNKAHKAISQSKFESAVSSCHEVCDSSLQAIIKARHNLVGRLLIPSRIKRNLQEHAMSAKAVHRHFSKEQAKATLKKKSIPEPARLTVQELLKNRFAQNRAFSIYSSDRTVLRVNLITDSVGAESLYGGVATSIIFASLLSRRLHATLRIITRHRAPDPSAVAQVLRVNGIDYDGNIEFEFAPMINDQASIDISPLDFFITTSWWATASTLQCINADRIIYILQEDERMFYPMGDEYIACQEVLENEGLAYVINSKLLFDHLSVDASLSHFKRNAVWFEPSFINPDVVQRNFAELSPKKMSFMFYARERNQRNMFYLGIKVIDAAIASGIIDLEKWNIVFVGNDFPEVVFCDTVVPITFKNISWEDYKSLIRQFDLGLTLMGTPHPSYPPLDLASIGAVSVSNSYGIKQDLTVYSDNIICSKLCVDDLLEALSKGVVMACDSDRRASDLKRDHILRNWHESFSVPLEWLAGRINKINAPEFTEL